MPETRTRQVDTVGAGSRAGASLVGRGRVKAGTNTVDRGPVKAEANTVVREQQTSMMKSPSDIGFHDVIMRSIPDGGIVVPVGSRVTCYPPPMDTDEDYLVLVRERLKAVAALKELGFENPTPSEFKEYEKLAETSQWSFSSLRLGDVNYIVTDSAFFFERFLTASHVAKSLNLPTKADRIMVFEAIRGVSFAGRFFPGFNDVVKDAGIRAHKAHPETEGALANNIFENLSASDPPF